MEMYANAWNLLLKSITHNDFLILIAAIITVIFFVLTLAAKHAVITRIKEWKTKRNEKLSYIWFRALSFFYTIFTTMITIFPLLGMLGTVCGLLGLDLANGNMENIKTNFFIALTSTAWGIIFSVLFKLLNSVIADGVEQQIENAKKLSEEL